MFIKSSLLPLLTLPNYKILTISILMWLKWCFFFIGKVENIVGNGKKPVTSIFSFSRNVFITPLSLGHLQSGLCGKGLRFNDCMCFYRRDATLSGPTGLTKFELKQVADFNDHESQVNVVRICHTVFLLINAPRAMQNLDREPLFCTQFAKQKYSVLYFFLFLRL